jgi:hypothetical protein
MQKLVWKNSLGDEIDLTSGNYGITQWEGFSNASLNIQSQQVPFQDGGVYLDSLINQRELSVTLKMQDNGNLEERYRMRRELIHILNPKLGEGYLIYTNDFISKRIKCVAQVPLFETHNSDTRGTPKASLSWTACEPYWEDLEETEVNLADTENIIINNGDVDIGVEITAQTNTNKISVQNVTQNKNIILSNVDEGVYKITTNTGNKKIQEVFSNFVLKSCSLSAAIAQGGNIFVANESLLFTVNSKSQFARKETNTIGDLRTFIKKEDYIYFYEQYVGVRRTKTFDSIITVLPVSISFDYNNLSKTSNGAIFVVGSETQKYSLDGLHWNNYTFPYGSLNGIIYNKSDGKYYGYSSTTIYSTSNLTSWTQVYDFGGSAFITSLFYDTDLNKFVVSSKNLIYTTTNFSSVTNVYTANNTVILNYVKDIYCFADGINLVKSTNLSSWVTVSGVTLNASIVYAEVQNGVYFLILNNGNILKSYDFTNWEVYLDLNTYSAITLFEGKETNDGYLTGRTSGNFDIGGISGPLATIILPGVEGILYSNRVFSRFFETYTVRFNNKFYVKNGTEIYESTDGINYILKTTVPYGAGEMFATDSKLLIYVYANNQTTIYSSTNVTTWTTETTLNYILHYIHKCDDKYYAQCDTTTSRYIGVSSDCINFESFQIINENQLFVGIRKYKNELIIACDAYETTNNSFVYRITGTEVQELVFNKQILGLAVTEDTIFVSIYDGSKYGLGVIGKFNNLEVYPDNQLGSVTLLQSGYNVYVNGYNIIAKIDGYTYKNIIAHLDNSSDISLGLKVSKNIIIKNFDGIATVKYRQKYIGV